MKFSIIIADIDQQVASGNYLRILADNKLHIIAIDCVEQKEFYEDTIVNYKVDNIAQIPTEKPDGRLYYGIVMSKIV